MEEQLQFAEALESLKDVAFQQGNVVSEGQIKECFSFMELSEEQMEMIREYLKKCKIGIDVPTNFEDYLTKEEKSYLDIYLQELETLKKVSDGEKEAIMQSAMVGDADAKNKLVEIFLPQVIEIAKLYAGQGVFLEDLIGEGNVAVAMAVQLCELEETTTMLEGMIGRKIMDAMEELINECADQGQTGQKIANKVNDILDKAKELAESLGRKVTPQELFEETQIPLEDILDACRFSANNIDYLEITEDGKQGF